MSAALALLATVAFIGVGALVGVRLLALAARTRRAPELAVGLSLFLLAGVSYPASLALVSGEVGLGPGRVISVVSALAAGVAWVAVFVFTWRGFRPGSRVAGAVVGAAGLAILACATANAARALTAETAPELLHFGRATLVMQVLALGAYAWTAVEGFRYHALMRRRLALGLADPVVANRFLLWGLTGVFAFVVVAGSTVNLAVGGSFDRVGLRLLTAVGGTGCAACLYLAFLPPRAWVRRLAARAPASAKA